MYLLITKLLPYIEILIRSFFLKSQFSRIFQFVYNKTKTILAGKFKEKTNKNYSEVDIEWGQVDI